MYLLDTNVISELRNGKPRQSAAVREWARLHDGQQLYLSAVTCMELEIGVQRMERKDVRQGQVLRTWLDSVLAEFNDRTLPFTALTAQFCAVLHVPDERSFRDSMIAATALEHRFKMVTRNVTDFEGTEVHLINPWAPAS